MGRFILCIIVKHGNLWENFRKETMGILFSGKNDPLSPTFHFPVFQWENTLRTNKLKQSGKLWISLSLLSMSAENVQNVLIANNCTHNYTARNCAGLSELNCMLLGINTIISQFGNWNNLLFEFTTVVECIQCSAFRKFCRQ